MLQNRAEDVVVSERVWQLVALAHGAGFRGITVEVECDR
jgi:hypothetical protein